MKIFVDYKRTPGMIYSDPKEWTPIKTKQEFGTTMNNLLMSGKLPSSISFDYDLETEKAGLEALVDFVNIAIKLRFTLPKIYLHCSDRRLAIDFENELNQYTKKTNIPYNFEYTKLD